MFPRVKVRPKPLCSVFFFGVAFEMTSRPVEHDLVSRIFAKLHATPCSCLNRFASKFLSRVSLSLNLFQISRVYHVWKHSQRIPEIHKMRIQFYRAYLRSTSHRIIVKRNHFLTRIRHLGGESRRHRNVSIFSILFNYI